MCSCELHSGAVQGRTIVAPSAQSAVCNQPHHGIFDVFFLNRFHQRRLLGSGALDTSTSIVEGSDWERTEFPLGTASLQLNHHKAFVFLLH